MSGNGSRRDDGGGRGGRGDEDGGYEATAGVIAAGVAALVGGVYWFAKSKQPEQQQQPKIQQKTPRSQVTPIRRARSNTTEENSVSSYLTSFLNRMALSSSYCGIANDSKFSNTPPPDNPCITNLNSLLSDIFVRYVQIKRDDFQLHYKVFDSIFQHLHQRMKDVDPYYMKYSSTVQFAGSHYDNLRIKKPDEFDMDIVIDLPLNLKENPLNAKESDIFIEPKAAGYVQLKMGVQFQKLPMRDGVEWLKNKAAFEWMDRSSYLLRSSFLDWFKSVVNKALNTFQKFGSEPLYYVDGVAYTIGKSESGPAMTLIIKNCRGFRLDVDLVPALKFPESRWPIGKTYRSIPPKCARGEWMVVGKAIRNGSQHDGSRSWRIALHNQERVLMHDTGNLRQAVRLLKKLRDSLGLKEIASYYVKTLFFWEIVSRDDKTFWQQNNPAFLFKLMVGKLHEALVNKNIPYFWNKGNNLIGGVDDRIASNYAAKLVPLMRILEYPQQYKQVAKYLLTPQEFKEYNRRFLHI